MKQVTLLRKRGRKTVQKYERASSIIPTLSYEKKSGMFIMADKTIGFAFDCSPICFMDQKLQERIQNVLNQDLPTGTTIQFILYRSPDINRDLHRMLAMREDQNNEFYRSIIKERIKFIKHHSRYDLISDSQRGHFNLGVIQNLRLVISVKLPLPNAVPKNEDLLEFERLKTKFKSSLQTIQLHPQDLTAPEYIRFMGSIVNWSSTAQWRHDSVAWDESTPINEQIFDYNTQIEIHDKHLKLGDTYVKVLSAKKIADVMFFGDALRYVGDLKGGNSRIKDNYMVVVNVYIPHPEKTKRRLDHRRKFAVNQSIGPMVSFVPELADKRQGFDILYDSLKEGAKPISVSYSVVIFSPDLERANANSMAASSLWRESRFDLMEDLAIQLPMFINCLPLCTDADAVRDLFRYKTMTTEHATPLLPVFGEWKGSGSYHGALISRNGQLMSLSLHDTSTNSNAVIAATSGSGKSFLVNELVTSYLSEGAQVWIIDVGRSYMKLCDIFKGDFVHFGDGSDICMSPFPMIEQRHDDSGNIVDGYEEDEDGVVAIVALMASSSGTLNEFQIAGLKRVMRDLWLDKKKEMLIDDIAQACLDHEDPRINDIGVQLYSFTSQGSYGRFFNGQNNITFKNDLTVLELDDLSGRTHLRKVVLLQLIFQIQQAVFLGDRKRKRIVIVDEAWDLLRDGQTGSFMEHAYRKFRKYKGSVVIATQSIDDLYENEVVGRPIVQNSANMFLLGQTKEAIRSVQKTERLALTEGGYRALESVHTVTGVYSEIFVRCDEQIGIGRLVVSDFHKLLYSTFPDDIVAIENYVKQGLSTEDAIRAVLRDRQQHRELIAG